MSRLDFSQSAQTNLDQDLALSRESKYRNSEKEVTRWVFDSLKIPQSKRDEYMASSDLIEILKDGLLLCQIGDLFGLPQSPTAKYRNSRMPFVQMENIMFFLKLCEMVGVSHDEMFQTVDIYERKDPYQVVVTLMALSRLAYTTKPDIFKTVIGPKAVKIKPQVPVKPYKLRL